MTQALNDIMEFDRVIQVTEDGEIVFPDNLNPYFELNVNESGEDEFSIPAGWALLRGYTGQYSYSGPVMHPSEFIGGGLESHIRETPGYYVALVVEGRCDYDGSTACTEDAGCDCEPAGWAVAYHEPAAAVAFRVDRHGSTPEVTAVFSGVQGTRAGGDLQGYAHNGQHCTVTASWYRNNTRPATPEEYAPLLSELQAIGYIVTVVQRVRWAA